MSGESASIRSESRKDLMNKIQFAIVASVLQVTLALAGQADAQQYPWRYDAPATNSVGRPVAVVAQQQAVGADVVPLKGAGAPSSVSDVVSAAKGTVPAGPGSPAGLGSPANTSSPANSLTSDIQTVPDPVATYQPETVIPPTTESVQAPSAAPVVADDADEAETDYCQKPPRRSWCNLGCERKLFGETGNGLQVGGWLSGGYHNRNNPLLNNRKGEANIHQLWLFADKAADRCGDWNTGYRADILYGIDAQDFQAFGNAPTGAPSGWDNSWDNGSYGWALPQAYLQVANQDWDIKLGKFFSPFGYETLGATGNFFYSRSFTRFNTEPFTLSGVLAERTIANGDSYLIGATAGWDTGFDSNSGGNLIFGRRRQIGDFINLTSMTSMGDTGFRGVGIMSSNVAEVRLTDAVQYVLQFDTLNLGNNQEFGIVQYLFRDVTECLALGARLEWWKSDLPFGGPTRSTYNFTVGSNYRVNSNLILRPELRFDWGALAVSPGQPIIGFDAVMTF